ncbi:MAG TPA: hypothetical protein VN836_07905 [Verrucomicrobiae bacterium]|nr:hypothetical protein [Verrucomicrobiae bacterium]
MSPVFADAIDLPLVFGFGLIVLIPLLLFEVGVEALILRKVWSIPFRSLCRLTFVANCLSLLAGIPVKILNAWLYSFLLPQDLPGFVARYPSAVAVGTLIYFVVTLSVEGAYAFRWLRRNEQKIAGRRIWKGILLANLASYAVVAPLHYYLTRPLPQPIHDFTRNASWSSHPAVKVVFTDGTDENLKSVRLDGSAPETIVPTTVRDYLLSADLERCLFRGTNGSLYLYRQGTAQCKFVLQSSERFLMNQVAFSPSGEYVAYANERSNTLEVVNVQTRQHIGQPLLQKLAFSGASVAWSTNEMQFYVGGFENGERFQFTIQLSGWLLAVKLTQTNAPEVLTCYGRIGDGGWYDSDDWGRSFNRDSCGDLKVYTEPGLGSHLSIYRGTNWDVQVEYLAVNPGLLHIARFDFGDVAFLDGCEECLFEANGYIYLLDIQNKRVGTVVQGGRFILLTPRYQKQL